MSIVDDFAGSMLADRSRLEDLAAIAEQVRGDADDAVELALAPELMAAAAVRGSGPRWELLASLAAADLTAARVIEAHLDAFGHPGAGPRRSTRGSVRRGGRSTVHLGRVRR